MNANKSVLIACGGTGGHLFPGIAVAQALRQRGVRSILAISEKSVDRTAAETYPDMEFLALPARPLPKPWSPAMPGFLMAGARAMQRCRATMREKSIGAVLGMGGFTSAVPVLAARMAGVPVFLHDSNAVPGKANRMGARFAHTFFLGLKEGATYLGTVKTKVVGTPVRSEFCQLPDRAEAVNVFGLSAHKKTLLVLGGSQGARALNRAAIDAMAEFDPDAVQVLLLSGTGDYQATCDYLATRSDAANIKVLPFCSQMPAAYACSDLVLARSGASTLSELSVVGLPAVLVPYPYAADDHQTANALAFTQHQAAELLPESEMNATSLAQILRGIFHDPKRLPQMARQMTSCARPNAAEIMADHIIANLQ